MPEMVVISPGVQVIADYNEPIFYNENYYWRNDGGVWYRSHTHTGGWVRYNAPRAILSIERPSAYVHYRASARAGAGAAAQERREDAKDRREDAKDRREDAKEDRKDAAKERQEDRKDAAERRKDQKEDKKEDKKDDKKHDKKHD